MRMPIIMTAVAASVTLVACTTYPAPLRPTAMDRTAAACGTYGYVDANNDGFVTGAEWNAYRTGSYDFWDTNRDGRISQAEFQNCYYGGGFYRDAYYNRDHWQNYYTGFDANRDGYLTRDEYWGSAAWARADRNRNGRIDANEWQWWM